MVSTRNRLEHGLHRPPRRTARRRVLAVGLLSSFLALTLVYEAGPAQAFTVPPPVVPIADAAGEVAAGSTMTEAVGAVCATGPACAYIGVGMLAIVAGETADTWVPWAYNKIKSIINTPPGTIPWTLGIQYTSGDPNTSDPSPFWSARFNATNTAGHTLTVGADTICRQSDGLQYQVIKGSTWETAVAYFNTDSFYWSSQVGTTNAINGWSTYYTTPATALDGKTPNPAHGQNNDGTETTADHQSLCNAGDWMVGTTITGTEGGHDGTATKVWQYGSRVDPNTADYDAQVNCVRPDGTTYARVAHSTASDNPTSGPGFVMPHCDAGDTPTGGQVSQGGRVVTSFANPGAGYPNGAPGPAPGAALPVSGWTADSQYDQSFPPSYVGDGNTATRWASVIASGDHWIAGTLSPGTRVGSLTMTAPSDSPTQAPADFHIDVQSGGVWKAVYGASGVSWAASESRTYEFAPVAADAIRVTSTRTLAQYALASLAELVPKAPSVQQSNPYPACTVAAPCAWSVWLDGVKCTSAVAACQSWTAQPPSHIECHYGPYVRQVSDCNFLERSYEVIPSGSPAIPATGPNTDGNPATYTGNPPSWQPTPSPSVSPNPQPSPTSTATATLDPQPQPSPTSSTATVPAPGTDPSPSGSPTSTSTAGSTGTPTGSPSGSPSPTISIPADCQPGTAGGAVGNGALSCDPRTDPPSSDELDCFPHGWGVFNPPEWVQKPVKCAIQWAFVPPDLQTQIGSFKDGAGDALDKTAVGKWHTLFGQWSDTFGAVVGPGGCKGPAVDIGFLSHKTGVAETQYPFDACSGPKATAAATSRIFLTVAITWLTGWRLVRIVGRPFGYSVELMNYAAMQEREWRS